MVGWQNDALTNRLGAIKLCKKEKLEDNLMYQYNKNLTLLVWTFCTRK
jgi:hypothetical protein